MRWLFHIVEEGAAPALPGPEGFVHCSYRDDVAESARLYFRAGARLDVLQIDPRRLGGVRVEEAETPRGKMPHVLGEVPPGAVRKRLALADVPAAPDVVTDDS
jgi:uncharacterized protein (DUF952 family)